MSHVYLSSVGYDIQLGLGRKGNRAWDVGLGIQKGKGGGAYVILALSASFKLNL